MPGPGYNLTGIASLSVTQTDTVCDARVKTGSKNCYA